jgi:protein TonB
MLGVSFSVLLHGIVLYGLRAFSLVHVDSPVEKTTLWVHAWQSPRVAPAAAQPLSALQPSRPRPSLAHWDERAHPVSHGQTRPSSPPATSPLPEPSSVHDDQIPNHVLGLVLHTVHEHFVYPPFARREGWEGEVLLAFRLDPEGEIHDVRVIRSSGYALLDENALSILRRIGSIPNARTWLRGRTYHAQIPVIYRLTG